MKNNLSIVLFCFIGIVSCVHPSTKSEAIERGKRRQEKKQMNILIKEKGNILEVLVRDSNYQHLDEIYQFNEDGKQLRYSLIAYCDSCFQKYLSKSLKEDFYKWKKINDSTYLSKYHFKSILNIHKLIYTYDIIKHSKSKIECKTLLENAQK